MTRVGRGIQVTFHERSAFTKPGKYGYYCDIHGGDPARATGMYGIITVGNAAK